MKPDIDRLAENHYADVDPAFTDDDLEAQKAGHEADVVSWFEKMILSALDQVEADDIRIIKESADWFGEFLTEEINNL